jgi:hypothetical protein
LKGWLWENEGILRAYSGILNKVVLPGEIYGESFCWIDVLRSEARENLGNCPLNFENSVLL